MSRFYLTLLLSFLLISTVTAGSYEVRVRSSLNVRSEPGSFAPVVGKLQNRDTISVIGIHEGWAEIGYEGKSAYVTLQFIFPVETHPAEGGGNSLAALSGDKEAVLYVILALSGILFILRRVRRSRARARGGLLWSIAGIFLVLSLLEIYYIFGLWGGLWFCSPDQVGWGWTIVNFFIFAAIVINQYRAFFEVLEDFNARSVPVDYRLGVYSYVAAVVLFIAGTYFFPDHTRYVVWGLLIAQLAQIGIIIYRSRRFPLTALSAVIVYLVGSAATLVILLHFLVVLFAVIVVGFFLRLIGSAGGHSSGSQTCDHCGSPR